MSLINLQISDEDQGKDQSQSTLMIDKAIENFKMSLWDAFGCPKIDNFGELICNELHKSETGYYHLIHLILKFQKKSLQKYVEILDQQATLLNIEFNLQDIEKIVNNVLNIEFLSAEATEDHKKFVENILKNIEDPYAIEIQNHMQDVFS